jgi:hypothetical protein
MAQGTTTVNFGTFPGATDTSVTVTGQSSILATSLVEAWVFPAATAAHSVDEHWVDGPQVMAGNIVAGTGFTIYASVKPQTDAKAPTNSLGGKTDSPRAYGSWTVAWVWN